MSKLKVIPDIGPAFGISHFLYNNLNWSIADTSGDNPPWQPKMDPSTI